MSITAIAWIFFVGVLAGRAWQDRIHRRSPIWTAAKIGEQLGEAAIKLKAQRKFAGPGIILTVERELELSDGSRFPFVMTDRPQ
jgi:hypothetical protein